MIEFNVKYWSTWENNTKPSKIFEGSIFQPAFVNWSFENSHYEFLKNDEDIITTIYVSQEFILVCYSEDSLHYPSPNNLFLYNLKKEVIKVIPPPAPKRGGNMPITSMGKTKMIEGVNHISVRIDDIGNSWTGNVEIHYLNSETFEYDPTFIETFFEYGR